jgi:hypothetical protein
VEQVHKHIVQAKPHDRDDDEFDKKYIGVAAACMEGPFQVEVKIIDNGTGKAEAVGEVFIDPDLFLEKPGNKKINQHADEADDAEFCHL